MANIPVIVIAVGWMVADLLLALIISRLEDDVTQQRALRIFIGINVVLIVVCLAVYYVKSQPAI